MSLKQFLIAGRDAMETSLTLVKYLRHELIVGFCVNDAILSLRARDVERLLISLASLHFPFLQLDGEDVFELVAVALPCARRY